MKCGVRSLSLSVLFSLSFPPSPLPQYDSHSSLGNNVLNLPLFPVVALKTPPHCYTAENSPVTTLMENRTPFLPPSLQGLNPFHFFLLYFHTLPPP